MDKIIFGRAPMPHKNNSKACVKTSLKISLISLAYIGHNYQVIITVFFGFDS